MRCELCRRKTFETRLGSSKVFETFFLQSFRSLGHPAGLLQSFHLLSLSKMTVYCVAADERSLSMMTMADQTS